VRAVRALTGSCIVGTTDEFVTSFTRGLGCKFDPRAQRIDPFIQFVFKGSAKGICAFRGCEDEDELLFLAPSEECPTTFGFGFLLISLLI